MADPWYQEGLRFECTGCGRCCRGAGNVWVSDDEIVALASRLEFGEQDFRRTHTRRAGGRGIVLRQKRNQDCVFWDGRQGCTVYTERPQQCRTYPFWRGNVFSKESWAVESRACPGIGEGLLRSVDEVTRVCAADGIPEHRNRLREGGSS